MRALKSRQHLLWMMAAALLLVFAAAFVFLSWSGWNDGGQVLVPESRRAALLGLAGMVVVFVLYALAQQRRLQALEEDLGHAELREETLRARFDELGALFDASNELAGRLDPAGMLDLAARRLRRGLEADACALFLLDPACGRLAARALAGEDGADGKGLTVKPGEGVTGLVFSTGETMVVDAGPLLGQLAVEMNLRRTPGAALSVPIRIGASALGVVNVVRFDPDPPYLQVHARMLESFAASLARAIERGGVGVAPAAGAAPARPVPAPPRAA